MLPRQLQEVRLIRLERLDVFPEKSAKHCAIIGFVVTWVFLVAFWVLNIPTFSLMVGHQNHTEKKISYWIDRRIGC